MLINVSVINGTSTCFDSPLPTELFSVEGFGLHNRLREKKNKEAGKVLWWYDGVLVREEERKTTSETKRTAEGIFIII